MGQVKNPKETPLAVGLITAPKAFGMELEAVFQVNASSLTVEQFFSEHAAWRF